MLRLPSLPRQSWKAVLARSAVQTGFAVVISIVLSHIILDVFSAGLDFVGTMAALLIPLVMAGPMLFFIAIRHEELSLAYARLEAAAALDSLTGCRHHGSFVEAVTGDLHAPQSRGGALLVVDADHFKSINDRFGHAVGDKALKLIVSAIRRNLGAGDILGRLGGEEFGIYLPGADAEKTRRIGDAIRHSVLAIGLDAGGETAQLSVSIGAAITGQSTDFGEMFREADALLYGVKDNGRNGLAITFIEPRPLEPAPLPEITGYYRDQKVAHA